MLGYYMGIDPGYENGAVCVVSHDFKDIRFFDIKNNLDDLDFFIEGERHELNYACLEEVHSSPLMGVTSAFNFGQGFAWCKALLVAYKVSYSLVLPITWQGVTGERPAKSELTKEMPQKLRSKLRAQDKTAGKKHTYDWCKRHFPEAELRSFSKDSNRADALAIAFYAWNESRKRSII